MNITSSAHSHGTRIFNAFVIIVFACQFFLIGKFLSLQIMQIPNDITGDYPKNQPTQLGFNAQKYAAIQWYCISTFGSFEVGLRSPTWISVLQMPTFASELVLLALMHLLRTTLFLSHTVNMVLKFVPCTALSSRLVDLECPQPGLLVVHFLLPRFARPLHHHQLPNYRDL